MKKGGKNNKKEIKEVKIPIRVVAEKKKVEIPEKDIVKKNKVAKLSAPLRIVKDKDNLPVLDGAKFYKEKVKKIELKKVVEDKPELKNHFPKVEPEKLKESPRKVEEKKEDKVFKKEKRVKVGLNIATISQKKREKILIASVAGIVSVICIGWVAFAKSNFSNFASQERKSGFSEESGIKDGFEDLKDKLQEFTAGIKERKEEPKIEEVATENNNSESEVIDKLKEKVLIEEIKNKIEEGEMNL